MCLMLFNLIEAIGEATKREPNVGPLSRFGLEDSWTA